MALIAGGALSVAVTRAGGLGMVGGAYAGTVDGEPDLDTELSLAKSEKFGVGFITWALSQAPHMLTKALNYSPFCVFLSFGDPGQFAAEIREAGALLICQVQFLAASIRRSRLVPQLSWYRELKRVDTVQLVRYYRLFQRLPYLKRQSPQTLLLAAGGIADGRGLAAALMLGADGVVVGSRLWASAEALTKESHTDKAIAVNGDSTVRTKALDALRGFPWPRQYSFRFLKNKLMDQWSDREERAFEAFGSQSAEYARARVHDDLDAVAVVCGEAVGLIHDRPSAKSIVESMSAQAEDLLRKSERYFLAKS
jgi:nitronate monooxygenase